MYTLVMVFSPDCRKVLTCYKYKQNARNFIGGSIKSTDSSTLNAAYRKLREVTGINSTDIDLKFVREERVCSKGCIPPTWENYITAGILQRDIELKEDYHQLEWIDVTDIDELLKMYGHGTCYVFLEEAKSVLGLS